MRKRAVQADLERGQSTAHRARPGERFLALELGRGIAASMVALSHAVSLCAEPRWFGTVPFGGQLANLNVGVDYFFVLSGFIITFVHWGDLGRPERLGHYLRRRFTRVFPPYWVVLGLIVPVYLAVPSLGEPRQRDWAYILTSFILVPMPRQPVLGVAWTLTFEMFFYLLLAVAVRFGWRCAAPLLAGWAGVIVICQAIGADAYPWSFLGSAYGLQFLLGVGLAVGLRKGDAPAPGLLLAAGAVLFFGLTVGLPGIQEIAAGLPARLGFGAAAGLMIAGGVTLERHGRLRVPALLLPIGAASYAIYLAHVVVESALIRAWFRLAPGALGPEALVLLLGAAGIAGGLVFHYLVEKPLMGVMRRRFG